MFLLSEKSQVWLPGPGKAFLGSVPTRPAGLVNAPGAHLIQTKAETPGAHPPWESGREFWPFAVADAPVISIGVPLASTNTLFNCQPPTIASRPLDIS